MFATIWFCPSRRMKGGDVRSELMVFRERLQAFRFCALDKPFSEHPIGLNPVLPSTVSPPYASTRALSNAERSKTSSNNPLLGTRRGDRNRVDVNGSGLGDESPVDTIYCKSCTRTAAYDRVQFSQTLRKFETENPPPLYVTSRVPRAYTACCTICHSQKKCNGTFSSRPSPTSH